MKGLKMISMFYKFHLGKIIINWIFLHDPLRKLKSNPSIMITSRQEKLLIITINTKNI